MTWQVPILPFVLSLSKHERQCARVLRFSQCHIRSPFDRLSTNGMTAHDCTCANTLRGEGKRPGVFPEQVLCLGNKHGDRPCTQEARWQIYRLVASSDGEEGAHERNTYG